MPKPKSRVMQGAASVPPLRRYQGFPKTELAVGLGLFAALGLLFRYSGIDLAVARLAYSAGEPHWPGQSTAPWSWLYLFGPAPAFLAGLLGLFGWLLSYRISALKPWRGVGLYLFALLLLGPGLLVNLMGKNLAGRPRPSDLLEFGGVWEFRHAFEFGTPGRGKSFLSGHASMAFYWLGLYFVFPKSRRFMGLAGALVFGALMSAARVTQGAHFLSDNLLCGALIFSLAAALSPLIHWQPAPEFFKRGDFLLGAALALAGWLLIANPVYEERALRWARTPAQPFIALSSDRLYHWGDAIPGLDEGDAVNLELSLQGGAIRLSFDGEAETGQLPLMLRETLRFSSLPGVKESFEPKIMLSSPAWPLEPSDLSVSLIQRFSGPFWALSGAYEAHLPAEKACEARLKTRLGAISIASLPKNSQVLLYGHFSLAELPLGFEAYGMNGFHRPGSGPLIVLRLEAPEIRFEK